MKYYAYVNNKHGCDYTIGCNRNLVKLKGNSLQEALAYLEQDMRPDGDGYYFADSIDELDEITVLEVRASCKVDTGSLVRKYKQVQQEHRAAEKRERERKEYERLAAKFSEAKQ